MSMSRTMVVIGAGLMGPAAAYNGLKDSEITRVILADVDQHKLQSASAKLSALTDTARLETRVLDLTDRASAVALMREAHVVLTALPWNTTVLAVRAALEASVPLVDLAIPDDDEMALLRRETDQAGGAILLGCGLEPGLTEIEALRLASMLDTVDAFHIMVGGIPETPTGPLGYKIVFGGDQLPLRQVDALVVENGEQKLVGRYSGVENTTFEGVGAVEAWNEGIIPWLLEMPGFANLQSGAQKTIRWPGYASKARMLNELGLLGTDPIDVNGTAVVPKDLVDTLLRPHVSMEPEDRDITLFRVEVSGTKVGDPVCLQTEMIDRFDGATGFTSMARTTAFTGAIIARMIAHGEITLAGLQTPDQLITGSHYDRMIEELAAEDVVFQTQNC